MKKLFVTMMVVVVSVSVMATQTAKVHIKLVGSNPTYATSTLRLIEDDARTAAYESGYDAESMMTQSNPYSVLLYSYVETHPCEFVQTNDLTNTNISFTTNMLDQDYTLEFSNFEGGKEYKLYDLVAEKEVVINGSTPAYAFSVAPAQVGRIQVLNRFVIKNISAGLDACFTDNHLTISNNPWKTGKIAVYDGATKVGDTYEGTKTDIPLTTLTAGKHYTVKFFATDDITGEAAKTLVIVPVTLP